MTYFDIILIGAALAMDCFAVATASAVCDVKAPRIRVLRMALSFGLFQGAMPLVGYAVGLAFAQQIARVDHWVAFVVLGALGVKMIREGLADRDECNASANPLRSMRALMLLSLATSIDAMATGLIFTPFPTKIVGWAAIIALCSLLFSLLGAYIGRRLGRNPKINMELVGGAVLILIGVRILVGHLLYELPL